MPRSAIRDQLVDTAIRLFNRHGYHATGVDRLMEETGIAKTTLYRHFRSKEDLIVAALAKVDEQSLDEMRAFVEAATGDPHQRILATFDLLALWLEDAEFKGCPFVAAAAEYGEPGEPLDPVFQQARLHKRLLLAYFEELVRLARIPDPKPVAQQLMMLHEGATAVAQVLGRAGVAVNAKAAAARLIGLDPAATLSP